ncbi:MAG: hypothetical protein KF784_06520 [Fimbriimonadaceae bacterium]|nr:hypothetical protein [Fimbriimonadaceae bacterium]
MSRSEEVKLTHSERMKEERFWRLWGIGVEILQNHEGSVQLAVKEAWQSALGLIEMREVPEDAYEDFIRLRAEYVDFRISTREFSVPESLITEAAARNNADAVIRLYQSYLDRQMTA